MNNDKTLLACLEVLEERNRPDRKQQAVVQPQEIHQGPLRFLDLVESLCSHLVAYCQEEEEIDRRLVAKAIQRFFSSWAIPASLERLGNSFSLTSQEKQILFLCAAAETKSELLWVYSQVSGDTSTQFATVGFVAELIGISDWEHLFSTSTLVKESLVQVERRIPLERSIIRVPENILYPLMDIPFRDARVATLAKLVEPSFSSGAIPHSHKSIIDQVRAYLLDESQGSPLILQVLGGETLSKERIVRAACLDVNRDVQFIDGSLLPDNLLDLQQFVRALQLDVKINRTLYAIDFHDEAQGNSSSEERKRNFLFFAIRFIPNQCIILSQSGLNCFNEYLRSIFVPSPLFNEKIAFWKNALHFWDEEITGLIGDLAEQFDLTTRQILTIARSFQQEMLSSRQTGRDELFLILWRLCKEQSRIFIDSNSSCQRVDLKLDLDDVILSEQQREILECIIERVRNRSKVYREWGLADKDEKGLGVIALFCGPSGTGKTMAAEALANTLNLDLYRIDLSEVVSKYIGETQKKLASVLASAKKCGAILLFDEADALFSKRCQVKESRDRYANMEVNYLLQDLERYPGVVILTSNQKSNIDPAFFRRFHFITEFSYPSEDERQILWEKYLTPKIPHRNIDINQLKSLTLHGANIRSAVTSASFIAASSNGPVGMEHLKRALVLEYSKLERPLPPFLQNIKGED